MCTNTRLNILVLVFSVRMNVCSSDTFSYLNNKIKFAELDMRPCVWIYDI